MIELQVGARTLFGTGRPYTNFLDIEVDKSLDALAGTFTFTATSTPAQERDFPIKVGQACRILIDGVAVITGYVEVISVSHSADNHTVTIQGRDKTADVIDSTIGGDFGKNTQVTTLVQFTREILLKAGITGIGVSANKFLIKPFGAGDILDAETGETIFEYLERYARKRQVLLTTDSDGDILYQQASGVEDKGTQLLYLVGDDRSNILSASVTNDMSALFNKYIVRAQSNLGASALPGLPSLDSGTSTQNLGAFDNLVRSSRVLNMVAETSSSADDCSKRAAWQRNIKRAQAFQYNCVVQGHLDGNGKPWELNKLIYVKDEYSGVEADLLLNSINWRYDLRGGSKTSLGFVEKDSYTIDLSEPLIDAEKNSALSIDLTSVLPF